LIRALGPLTKANQASEWFGYDFNVSFPSDDLWQSMPYGEQIEANLEKG
jgi:hypothetical protein